MSLRFYPKYPYWDCMVVAKQIWCRMHGAFGALRSKWCDDSHRAAINPNERSVGWCTLKSPAQAKIILVSKDSSPNHMSVLQCSTRKAAYITPNSSLL